MSLSRSKGKKEPASRVSENFKKNALRISRQLRERDADRVWVIDPRESKLLSLWDSITTTALIYTALVTPYEVGFLSASTSVDFWFVINRVLDVIFILDMALQFCVVYQKVQTSSGSHQDDASWVTARRTIVRNYLFGWFPLDFFSILPSVFDIIPLVDAASGSIDTDAELAEKLSGFRAIRALRLIKLVRLIRASRLLTRWQARIGLSHQTITLLKIVTLMSLSAHWYACLIALQAVLHDDPAGTWLGLQGHCESTPIADRLKELDLPHLSNISTSQVFGIQCSELSPGRFYLAAFSWSCMVITGLGGTDAYPSQDAAETVIVTFLVVGGALMWAKVLATFCDLATNSDPAAVEYRQALDDLNRFCGEHAFAPELTRRLRQFFHQRKHVMMAKSASSVINKMSTSLQIEVVMIVHQHWLQHIWFLRGAEPACLVQLALRMEPCVFAPSELPEPTHLYIIHRGIVMHGGRVLTSGKMWGEEMILDAAHATTTPAVARCMTYVEVYSISRQVFFKVTSSFDTAARLVRRGAVLVIARRGVIKLVKQLRQQRDEGDGRSFMDMVLDASQTAQGHMARVNASATVEGQGMMLLQLTEELVSTKTSVDAANARLETQAAALSTLDEQMSAMRDGINRLLEKGSLPPIRGKQMPSTTT